MGLIFNGKRAFFLTLLALILSSFFILVFSSRITQPPDYKVDVVTGRINVLGYYTDNFFSYAESVTTISGYAALQGLLADMNSNRAYSTNFMSDYPSCALNGTIAGSMSIRPCPGMADKTISVYLQNLSSEAAKELKVSTTFRINNITVAETEDPFEVSLVVNMTVNVSDTFASIVSTRTFAGIVPITGLQDPIFILNGTYNRTIMKTNISKRPENWTSRDLEQLYNRQEYRPSNIGMSFINRMKGNFSVANISASRKILGIESIINHTHPSVAGLLSQNISIVDFLFLNRTYFNCSRRTGSGGMQIGRVDSDEFPSGIPTSAPYPFYLDWEHMGSFDINGSNRLPSC